MGDLEEIRDRVDMLEAEVARLREDAAATRTLAAMADRDASEVRSALREQQRQGEAISEIAAMLRRLTDQS